MSFYLIFKLIYKSAKNNLFKNNLATSYITLNATDVAKENYKLMQISLMVVILAI